VSPASATGADTAADIRRVALRLFAQNGYETTTMREIASAVGVKAGSLYNHFDSKEEILWELTRGALLDLRAQIDSAIDDLGAGAGAGDRLGAFINAHVRFHAVNSERARIVNRQMPGLTKGHYREVVALRRTFEDQLADILEAGVREGSFTLLDARLSVYAILQMCIAVSNWFRKGGDLTVDEIAHTYVALAQRMVTAPKPPARTRSPRGAS
jgi:TetR/AcrR family transcriptional regulator, cholesterol catabolism regulator